MELSVVKRTGYKRYPHDCNRQRLTSSPLEPSPSTASSIIVDTLLGPISLRPANRHAGYLTRYEEEGKKPLGRYVAVWVSDWPWFPDTGCGPCSYFHPYAAGRHPTHTGGPMYVLVQVVGECWYVSQLCVANGRANSMPRLLLTTSTNYAASMCICTAPPRLGRNVGL